MEYIYMRIKIRQKKDSYPPSSYQPCQCYGNGQGQRQGYSYGQGQDLGVTIAGRLHLRLGVTIASAHKKMTKYLIFLQPQAFCDALYAPNSFSAGAPPWTQLGELTTLPQTHQSAGEGDTPSTFPTPLSISVSRISFPESWQPYSCSYLLTQ